MNNLEKLKTAKSLSEFSALLGYKSTSLAYIIYKIPKTKKYNEFEIDKKNGGKRKIQAPTEKLKTLQKRLSYLLNDCLDIISKDYRKSLSHGFRKKHSIITNADKHKNRRYVLNIDLKNFFPSINFGRVRGYFIKNNNFCLEPKIATIIAQISCFNNELPQGSPCSPVISNLIGHILDIRLANLAKKYKCTYSRYADDITFSTNKKEFPQALAFKSENGNWNIGSQLSQKIKKLGFEINPNKTSMQFKTNRQTVTGLVVNKKVNISKEYYKSARSYCHELFQKGIFYFPNKNHKNIKENKEGTINQLEGILSYIYKVKNRNDKDHFDKKRNNPKSIRRLYKNFLYYKHFYSLLAPLILTEGKTDIIYLKYALLGLKANFKSLIEIENEKINYKIKFKHLSNNVRDVLSIASGSSGLLQFLKVYQKNICWFNKGGKNHPVIILIDNDDGAKEFKDYLKIKNSDTLQPFYFYTENLYILLTQNDKPGSIEDLFKKETLEIKVDGKRFNKANIKMKEDEYSKNVFADQVIKKNKENIDFSGFTTLFENIVNIVDDYIGRRTT